jgi:diguanylate cyclase (GGDEF)-like protein/PAS domain S-box-containing protein
MFGAVMGRVLVGCWFALLLGFFSLAAWAQTGLNFAVLAFHDKALVHAQWSPIVSYLEANTGKKIHLAVYSYAELDDAIERHEVDVLFTNPSHFVVLKHRYHLSEPLATLARRSRDGARLSLFGGTIFARADANTIQRLTDIEGQRIATASLDAFGGYQMQLFELLQAGLALPHRSDVSEVGLSEHVVTSVLEGRADVGFVRTGVLEGLAAAGKLDLAQIKVINRQRLPVFPYVSSTRLYPEWPICVMPWVDDDLQYRLKTALLSISPDGAPARSAGIYGFNNLANYNGVEELLRRLSLPPFERSVMSSVTLLDVWQRHTRWVVFGIALILLALVVMGLRLAVQNQRIQEVRAENKRHRQYIAEFNRDFETFLAVSSDFIYFKDEDNRFRFCSQTLADITGHASWRDMIGKNDFEVFPADTAKVYNDEEQAIFNEGKSVRNKIDPYYDAQGRLGYVQTNKWPLQDERGKVVGVFGISRDVTEQIQAEEKLRLASTVFSHAREGIVITNAQGDIVEVNEAFSRITGYARADVMGKKPSMLQSGRQDADFYALMWQTLLEKGFWRGELWNRRKDGAIYAEMLTISAVYDAQKSIRNYVALFSDITQMKTHEAQLEHIAHYDALTGLPNRLLLADRLHQALVQCDRRGQSVAVIYLDLDGFKAVNDTQGHDVGDQLLMTISQRMKAVLRDGDTLARIGGDEFVAVLIDLECNENCRLVLDRLLAAAAEPVAVGDVSLRVSASIGVTTYPQDQGDADQLMRHADQAMYRSKKAGRNCYHLFDPEQD